MWFCLLKTDINSAWSGHTAGYSWALSTQSRPPPLPPGPLLSSSASSKYKDTKCDNNVGDNNRNDTDTGDGKQGYNQTISFIAQVSSECRKVCMDSNIGH